MKRKATLDIENCCDCPHSRLEPSSVAYDSFDMADEDLVCTKVPGKTKTRYETVPYRAITISNRPWQTRDEAKVPLWYPLIK